MYRVPYKGPINVAMLFGILGPRLQLSIRHSMRLFFSVVSSYSNVIFQENLIYLLPRFACFHYNVATCQYPLAYNS